MDAENDRKVEELIAIFKGYIAIDPELPQIQRIIDTLVVLGSSRTLHACAPPDRQTKPGDETKLADGLKDMVETLMMYAQEAYVYPIHVPGYEIDDKDTEATYQAMVHPMECLITAEQFRGKGYSKSGVKCLFETLLHSVARRNAAQHHPSHDAKAKVALEKYERLKEYISSGFLYV